MNTVERFTRYLLTVECRYCGDSVYPHEDDARETVKQWMEHEDIHTIDDLRARADRICAYHTHMEESVDNA
jgi:hypothetical protein